MAAKSSGDTTNLGGVHDNPEGDVEADDDDDVDDDGVPSSAVCRMSFSKLQFS